MRNSFVPWVLLALIAFPLSAQVEERRPESPAGEEVAPPEAQVQAMERVLHWVGEWTGSGWSLSPDRVREEFEIFERVAPRLGGSTLLIEGRGVTVSDDGVRRTTHESLAVLSFDEHANHFRWRTYDLRGTVRDPEFVVDADAFRWGFRDEENGVLIRFTITIQGDSWQEIGEVSPDEGENWYRILEMNLERRPG